MTYIDGLGRNSVPDIPMKKIERYKALLVDCITNGTPIGALEANGIRKALSELTDYKRLASIDEVVEMLRHCDT